MQREANEKTSANNTIAAQDRTLHDELLQELAQRKITLENLTIDSASREAQIVQAGTSERVAAGSDTLRTCVEQTLRTYFMHLDGQPVNNIYEMVLNEVELPLLEVVMRYTQHNQCKAAELLGLSRGTLRKKLQQHGLL